MAGATIIAAPKTAAIAWRFQFIAPPLWLREFGYNDCTLVKEKETFGVPARFPPSVADLARALEQAIPVALV
jgi:hypothetical protein